MFETCFKEEKHNVEGKQNIIYIYENLFAYVTYITTLKKYKRMLNNILINVCLSNK